jgi:hypothetical protein
MNDDGFDLLTCRARAIEYLDGDPPNPTMAVSSMISDMMKGAATRKLLVPSVMAVGRQAAAQGELAVRRWLDALVEAEKVITSGTIH